MLKLLRKAPYGKYIFYDTEGKGEVSMLLEFYDDFDLDIGDTLVVNIQLLDRYSEWYAPLYAFEVVKNNLRQVSTTTPKIDLAVAQKGNKEYLLKRLYG
ncbi:MAG: hypothetical protein IKQ31_00775 [Clostridia bacterium]|nr:hypothetical protein [Clostridia bacterium]